MSNRLPNLLPPKITPSAWLVRDLTLPEKGPILLTKETHLEIIKATPDEFEVTPLYAGVTIPGSVFLQQQAQRDAE